MQESSQSQAGGCCSTGPACAGVKRTREEMGKTKVGDVEGSRMMLDALEDDLYVSLSYSLTCTLALAKVCKQAVIIWSSPPL